MKKPGQASEHNVSAMQVMSAMVSAPSPAFGREPPLLPPVEDTAISRSFGEEHDRYDLHRRHYCSVEPKVGEVSSPKRRKTGGRTKGTPNRVTRDIRSALRDLADTNAGAVQGWLERVAEDDPGEAVRLWLALLRYVTPTLQAAAIADLTPARNNKNALYQMTDAELIAAIQDEHAATVFPALADPNNDRESPPTDDDDPLFQ